MTTREDSDLLSSIKSPLSTKNNYEEQLKPVSYFPSLIYGLALHQNRCTFYNSRQYFKTLSEKAGSLMGHDTAPAVEAMRSHIKQLFNNLLNYAIKFGKQQQPLVIRIFGNRLAYHVTRRLYLPVGKNCFKIVIQDNGIGLGEEDAERISKSFGGFKAKHYILGHEREITTVLLTQKASLNSAQPLPLLPERQTTKKA